MSELLVLLAVALLLFGRSRIAEIGRAAGEFVRSFRSAR